MSYGNSGYNQGEMIIKVIDQYIENFKRSKTGSMKYIYGFLDLKPTILPTKIYFEMMDTFPFLRMFKNNLFKEKSLTLKIVDLILKMNWIFLYKGKNKGFLITDNPFIPIPPKDFDKNKKAGLLTPRVKITCPLSNDICLQIIEEGTLVHYLDADKSILKEINLELAIKANRFIYAKDKVILHEIFKGL